MAKQPTAKTDSPRQFTSSEVYFDRSGTRHRPGKVFTLPAGVRPGKSMVEVKDGKPKETEASPETLSELAKETHKAQGNALV